jgi:hypothetical protein
VLGDLAKIGWAQKPNIEAYETLFAAIFVAFKKAQPECDLEALAAVAFFQVQEFLRRRSLVQFRDKLIHSTYLEPVVTIADEVRIIRERLAAQVGHSLGRAIQKAKLEGQED